jgi:16S rRNA (guanine527-N7)-methyltransferase
VKAEDFAPLIQSRLAHASVDASVAAVAGSAAYLALLARWNQRINLTAFNLTAPTDEAIDRLIVEPLSAARFVDAADRTAVDIGSGGGSPAFPFRLAAPALRIALIEARTRKSAFLREAARSLGLADVRVDTERFDAEWLGSHPGFVDLVTMRAVRADEELWRALERLVRPGGRLFWFVDLVKSPNTTSDDIPAFGWQLKPPLPGQDQGLAILTRC